MKMLIDQALMKKMTKDKVGNEKNALLEACEPLNLLGNNQTFEITFGWPSLLEYLGLGLLFENFPKFNDQNQLFAFMISTLNLDPTQDLLIRLYEQLFVECLTHVKNLPQIDPSFLIREIQNKRFHFLFSQANELFSSSLNHYEKILIENPYHTIHDLTLYLAWDRVCVGLASLFEYSSPDLKVINGMKIWRECLVESFEHITAQGRTTPGFFRMIEAFYAYQMREENLEIYTEPEWLILCQSSQALKSRETLPDVLYIDAALMDEEKEIDRDQEKNLLRVFTLDSVDRVQATLSFTHYMLKKLKLENPNWRYTLGPVEVVCLREYENALFVNKIVHD